ncbi:MAG: hypothetical protein HY586_06620 [Candidatus Omnitrophica bacterium]|nr:hypothetical protein [Candidatus Omnitrophota bacterium]
MKKQERTQSAFEHRKKTGKEYEQPERKTDEEFDTPEEETTEEERE